MKHYCIEVFFHFQAKQLNKTNTEELSEVEMVLYGHVSPDLPDPPSRLIRVFLSSTFSGKSTFNGVRVNI